MIHTTVYTTSHIDYLALEAELGVYEQFDHVVVGYITAGDGDMKRLRQGALCGICAFAVHQRYVVSRLYTQ